MMVTIKTISVLTIPIFLTTVLCTLITEPTSRIVLVPILAIMLILGEIMIVMEVTARILRPVIHGKVTVVRVVMVVMVTVIPLVTEDLTVSLLTVIAPLLIIPGIMSLLLETVPTDPVVPAPAVLGQILGRILRLLLIWVRRQG